MIGNRIQLWISACSLVNIFIHDHCIWTRICQRTCLFICKEGTRKYNKPAVRVVKDQARLFFTKECFKPFHFGRVIVQNERLLSECVATEKVFMILKSKAVKDFNGR